jgi:hypothetical protein
MRQTESGWHPWEIHLLQVLCAMDNLNPYPLTMTNIAMRNGPVIEVYLLKMVIFHGYVK